METYKLLCRIKHKFKQARCAPHLLLLYGRTRLQLMILEKKQQRVFSQIEKDLEECARLLAERKARR